jgi:hypothetical protein
MRTSTTRLAGLLERRSWNASAGVGVPVGLLPFAIEALSPRGRRNITPYSARRSRGARGRNRDETPLAQLFQTNLTLRAQVTSGARLCVSSRTAARSRTQPVFPFSVAAFSDTGRSGSAKSASDARGPLAVRGGVAHPRGQHCHRRALATAPAARRERRGTLRSFDHPSGNNGMGQPRFAARRAAATAGDHRPDDE